jgi:hypothetical protein
MTYLGSFKARKATNWSCRLRRGAQEGDDARSSEGLVDRADLPPAASTPSMHDVRHLGVTCRGLRENLFSKRLAIQEALGLLTAEVLRVLAVCVGWASRSWP